MFHSLPTRPCQLGCLQCDKAGRGGVLLERNEVNWQCAGVGLVPLGTAPCEARSFAAVTSLKQ